MGLLIYNRGEQTNKDFLKTLKGEILYRSPAVCCGISYYKISANGNDRVLLARDERSEAGDFVVVPMSPMWENYKDKFSTLGGVVDRERLSKGLVAEKANLYTVNESGEKKLLYEYPRGVLHDLIGGIPHRLRWGT